MKILKFCLIFLFFPIVSYSQLMWQEVTNVPAPFNTNYWLEVYFLPSDANYGWICGYNGYIIRTTDKGATWNGSVAPGGGQLEGIFFPSKSVGYTSGGGKIFKSIDGGATWRDISPSSETELWGCYFLDENLGVAVGGGCGITGQFYFKTTNGGNTWTTFTLPIYNSGLTDVVLNKDGTGYASGSGKIFKTFDFGSTWSYYCTSGDDDWQEDLWVNGKTILVPYSGSCSGGISSVGGARISTDMGKTWRQKDFGFSMFGTFLQSPLKGWCVGWDGAAHYTVDGGINWIDANCGTNHNQFDDIWFVNDTLGYIVGDGIFKSRKIQTIKPTIKIVGDTNLCEGETLYLEVNGTYNNYVWSSGETSRRIFPKATGAYWCVASNSACESGSTDTVRVVVSPSPKASIIASPDSVACIGDTIVLKVNGSYNRVSWANSGETTDSIKVTASGTYMATVTNQYGCTAESQIKVALNARPNPSISALANTFCDGDTLILNADKDYTNYVWTKDGQVVSQGSKSISITDGGDYILTAYSGACSGNSAIFSATKINDSNRIAFSYLGSDKKTFTFDSTSLMDLNCQYLTMTNLSKEDTISIASIFLFQNIDFSIPPSQANMNLLPLESKKLQVCFSPKAITRANDTIFISDKCSPHYIRLVGYGMANEYSVSSECNSDLEVYTTKLDKYWYSFGTPHSWQDVITVKMKAHYKNSAQFKIKVYDIYGEYRGAGVYSSESISEDKGEYYESGAITFNSQNLPNGVYLIAIETPFGLCSEKAVIIK